MVLGVDRVQGSGFGVHGAGFRVQGLGFRVQDSRFRVQGSGFRVRVDRERGGRREEHGILPEGCARCLEHRLPSGWRSSGSALTQ